MGPSPSQTFKLPDFTPVLSSCEVAAPAVGGSYSIFKEIQGKYLLLIICMSSLN